MRIVLFVLFLCFDETSGHGSSFRRPTFVPTLPRGGSSNVAASTASSNTTVSATITNAAAVTTTAVSSEQALPEVSSSSSSSSSSELGHSPQLKQQQQALPLSSSTSTSHELAAWKQALPERLRSKGPRTLQMIQLGNVDIYLLGTAHVSNDSSADVHLLLNCIHPSCIFVELCDARIPLLEGEPATVIGHETTLSAMTATTTSQNGTTTNETASIHAPLSFWQKVQSIQQAQGASRLQALSTVLLTSVQEDYAQELGVELGGEFRCAHRYWVNRTRAAASTSMTSTQQQRRPHLILGDRPLYLTLVRAWESLWWWPKIKVVVGLLWSSWHKPDKEEIRRWLETVLKEETDVLTESFKDLRQHFPTLFSTIISERDAWLAAKLVQTCRALTMNHNNNNANAGMGPQQQQRQSLVAIVGAGHVPGICDWLTNKTKTESTSPEQVLSELVITRRWANDPYIQNKAIPSWITDVTELNDPL